MPVDISFAGLPFEKATKEKATIEPNGTDQRKRI